jgi:tRNA A37 methylthiotransferase MiaB
MEQQVPVHIARERNKVLRDFIAEKKQAFMKSLVGSEVEAVTLTNHDEHNTEALTDNYQKMHLSGQYESNRLVRARVTGIEGDALVASTVS